MLNDFKSFLNYFAYCDSFANYFAIFSIEKYKLYICPICYQLLTLSKYYDYLLCYSSPVLNRH